MQFNTAFFLSTQSRAILLMILSAVCWGLGTVMSKGVLAYFPPLMVLVTQLTSSVAFLWTIALIQQPWQSVYRSRLSPVNLLRLGFPGLLEPGLSYILGLIGLTMTTASSASLISATEPVMVLALAWMFLKEQIRPVLLGFSGIAVGGGLLTVSVEMQLNGDSVIGNLLIVMGTFCAALYGVLSRSAVQTVNPVMLAAIQQSFGLIWVILIWLNVEQGKIAQFSTINPVVWILAIASGIVQYALAFWLYLQAIKTIPVSIAAQFLSLIPVFGACGAYLFLNERLTLLQGLGMLLVMVSVAGIAQFQQKTQSQ
ncbi:MAG TPA: DMT family transporter [Leptolyngbyaceae cyanobacterium]